MVAPNSSHTPGSQRREDPDAARRTHTVSAKQLRANRRNARKSTGPRTEEGKRRVAANAVTHGVFARELLLPDENREHFAELRDGLIDSVRPQNTLELTLVDQMLAAQWKVLRVQRAERTLHELQRESLRRRASRWFSRQLAQRQIRTDEEFERFEATGCKNVYDNFFVAAAYLITREVETPPAQSHFSSDLTLAADVRESDNQSLERLGRYEQRLHSQFHRSLRDLLTLRHEAAKQGWADLPASPYAARTDETLEAGRVGTAHHDAQAPGGAHNTDHTSATFETGRVGTAHHGADAVGGAHPTNPGATPATPASPLHQQASQNKPISTDPPATAAATERCSDAAGCSCADSTALPARSSNSLAFESTKRSVEPPRQP